MSLFELIKKQNVILGEKLIKPKIEESNKKVITKNLPTATGDGVLVFSSLYNIYMLDKELIKIAKRPSKITNLCVTEDGLYDAGYYGIFNTIDNKLITTRPGPIRTLFHFNSVLFDGGDYGIFRTLQDEFIGGRDGPVTILTAFGNRLIDVGIYGIYDTLSHKSIIKTPYFGNVISVEIWRESLVVGTVNGQIIHLSSKAILASRNKPVIVLKAWNGNLYDAGDYGIYDIKTKELIATRDNRVDFLFVWNNELYDAGPYGIYNTMNNTKIGYINFITAVAIIPAEIAEKIRKKI